MTRIGVYGGTYNPPHLGHRRAAEAFADEMRLDRVLILPAFLPPHKQAAEVSAEDRLQMCRLAFADDMRMEVCDLEVRRGGRSYTVDTMHALREMYPNAQLFLLVGTDMLQSFRQWRQWEEILRCCTVCAMRRRDGDVLDGDIPFTEITALPLEISSTALRDALRRDLPTDELLHPDVRRYIRERGLYLG